MKLRRIIAAICVGLILAGLLTGCARKTLPLPEGMDEAKLTAAGREVLSELRKEEYDKVAERFRSDVKQANGVTAQMVQEMMEQWANPIEVGEFIRIKKISTSGTEGAETGGYVLFDCKYTRKVVGIAMQYDLEMNLIGLTVGQGEEL